MLKILYLLKIVNHLKQHCFIFNFGVCFLEKPVLSFEEAMFPSVKSKRLIPYPLRHYPSLVNKNITKTIELRRNPKLYFRIRLFRHSLSKFKFERKGDFISTGILTAIFLLCLDQYILHLVADQTGQNNVNPDLKYKTSLLQDRQIYKSNFKKDGT